MMEYTLCLAEGVDPAAAFKPLEGVLSREFARDKSVQRQRFVMADSLARKVAQSKKTTTIRIDRRAVEYPAAAVLPLFTVGQLENGVATAVANVRIGKVVYKRLRHLTKADAKRDGFASRGALLAALKRFYGTLNSDELVSIYEIRAVEWPPLAAQSV